ncbi:hypothetical protein HY768_04565 [candidate division TA06 bacterium]|uniref:Uncharacterized protein n=1 Tax=candidate division TA06 bacterium TaxID=2250710 RepID=A0A933I8A7_UNCT6|nr:hypothetical protein [candidate division TA06 bacterium]
MAWIKNIFHWAKPLSPGLYHYRGQQGVQYFRLHLRIKPAAREALVINASKILHLNQTAAELAKHIIEGDDAKTAAEQMGSDIGGSSRPGWKMISIISNKRYSPWPSPTTSVR